MPDSIDAPEAAELPAQGELPTQVSNALGSVWKQYLGEKPAPGRTEIRDNKVSFVLEDAVSDFEGRMAAGAHDPDDEGRVHTRNTYRNDAIAAVTRATRRRVVAFVSDHDAKTDVATEVFILESRRGRGLLL